MTTNIYLCKGNRVRKINADLARLITIYGLLRGSDGHFQLHLGHGSGNENKLHTLCLTAHELDAYGVGIVPEGREP